MSSVFKIISVNTCCSNRMSTYGKKLLGMSQNKANLPRKPLNILTNLPNLVSNNGNYDIGTMKMFLDTLKTPAEMRGIQCDERRSAEVEVAEEALDMIHADDTTDRPLAFGAVAFRTFGTGKDMPENQLEDGDDQPAVEDNPEGSDNLLGNFLTPSLTTLEYTYHVVCRSADC